MPTARRAAGTQFTLRASRAKITLRHSCVSNTVWQDSCVRERRQKKQRISRSLEQWLTILAVALISLVAFETLAVATAMPFVVEFLDGQHLYALAAGVALATQLMTTALAGPWTDAKGPKPSLYTGLGLFVLGLTVASFAPNIEVIVLGRAIQGLGGGLMIVPLYVFVGNYVAPERQPKIFAWFSAAWVVPSLIGPFVAGFFVEHLNWRLVFGIVPLVILLILPMLIVQFRKFFTRLCRSAATAAWSSLARRRAWPWLAFRFSRACAGTALVGRSSPSSSRSQLSHSSWFARSFPPAR